MEETLKLFLYLEAWLPTSRSPQRAGRIVTRDPNPNPEPRTRGGAGPGTCQRTGRCAPAQPRCSVTEHSSPAGSALVKIKFLRVSVILKVLCKVVIKFPEAQKAYVFTFLF